MPDGGKQIYISECNYISMEFHRCKLIVVFLGFLVILSGCSLSERSIPAKSEMNNASGTLGAGTLFYFIQLTDTHVMSKVFDPSERSKLRLELALGRICSFDPKPAFVVITGDLTNWGGSWLSGALNCRAFASCFFQRGGQLYADENYSIPVYTTPGNHDYFFVRNLDNYHRFINKETRYIINYSDMSLLFMGSGPALLTGGAGLYDDDMMWLDHALDVCNASMKVVLMHHPAVNERGKYGVMSAVLARNREAFVTMCEASHVELVLTGHTHHSMVYDGTEHTYNDSMALNCSLYPTLFVQTDDTAIDINYRNVTVSGTSVWLGSTVRIPVDGIAC
jgi:Icc-related predicted phosphoesterase